MQRIALTFGALLVSLSISGAAFAGDALDALMDAPVDATVPADPAARPKRPEIPPRSAARWRASSATSSN